MMEKSGCGASGCPSATQSRWQAPLRKPAHKSGEEGYNHPTRRGACIVLLKNEVPDTEDPKLYTRTSSGVSALDEDGPLAMAPSDLTLHEALRHESVQNLCKL